MPDATEPLVSVITLNYNHAKVTCEFLDSCRNLLYSNYEILVCDMASQTDPSPLIAAGNYAKTRLLLSPHNLGFAGGNNWGISQARGDYIFIVNNDTEVTPDLLHKLLAAFDHDPAIGVVCPKIKYWDNPDIIQYAGFNKMNLITGRTSTIGDKEKDRGQYNISGPTEGAHGCAMMVKREVIDKIGSFPSKFFLYYEEWDWSARIMKAGYKIWYESSAVIYHKESMSVGKNNPMKVYYHTRNRILYMRRNTTAGQLVLFGLFFTFFTAPKAIFKFTVTRQFAQLRNFVKGAVWNLYSSSHSAVK
jgi:GT2 family glycosyltransferase